jgi:hypothetical protein
MTPRITPKSGSTYQPGQIIRLEFPAQGYVNPANTTLEFDVTLTQPTMNIVSGVTAPHVTRFQNNIQSIFNRVRIMYGSTPLEDIINYNQIVRLLTEWTGTTQVGTLDQTSICEGVGGVVMGAEGATQTALGAYGRGSQRKGFVNIRQAYIQGIDTSTNEQLTGTLSSITVTAFNELTRGDGFSIVPIDSGNFRATRRYQVSLATGLFTQEKLIPTKFMASQFAIEITLATEAECIYSQYGDVTGQTAAGLITPATYSVSNVNLIPEILEFDASYDAMFLKGLQEDGVPIKFSSWHTYIFGTGGSSNLNLQIQERSRSVKALFAVQRRAPYNIKTDSGACFLATIEGPVVASTPKPSCTLQSYQYRIGGRYFPASPVQISDVVGGQTSNGGAEAFVELQKALNVVGDMRLATGVNLLKWGVMPYKEPILLGGEQNGLITYLSETDYAAMCSQYQSTGQPFVNVVTQPRNGTGDSFSGNMGSQCFAMAIDLETSNGMEISGLNAEEQSDIALIATYNQPQNKDFVIEVYSYYDAMLILRENNVIELIQ